MAIRQIVELCAGTSAVALAAIGAPRFPVTRVGSKAGYTDVILELMGIKPGSLRSAVLIESDPAMAEALRSLLLSPSVIAKQFARLRASGTERQVWNEAKGRSGTASFLIRMAGARGGVGGFRGVHRLRPQASSIPTAIEDRIWAFDKFLKSRRLGDIQVLCADVESYFPFYPIIRESAVAYIDPPYVGRLGIGARLGRPIEHVARKFAWFGIPVYVSEARPLEGATWSTEITRFRRGQSRRSLTTSNAEFISYWEPRKL